MSKRKSTDLEILLRKRYKSIKTRLKQCYKNVKRNHGLSISSSSSDSDDSDSGHSQPTDCDQTRECEASDPIMSNVSTNVPQVPVINSTVSDIAVHEDTEGTPNQEETSELDSDLLENLSNDPSNIE